MSSVIRNLNFNFIQVFAENNKLPLHLSTLINSAVPVDIMNNNSVVWHKSCRLVYSKTKAEKLVNRQESPGTPITTNLISPTNLRPRSINTENTNQEKCFLCELYKDEDLHDITTIFRNTKDALYQKNVKKKFKEIEAQSFPNIVFARYFLYSK